MTVFDTITSSHVSRFERNEMSLIIISKLAGQAESTGQMKLWLEHEIVSYKFTCLMRLFILPKFSFIEHFKVYIS